VTESNLENYRVRRCVIYFYLEDESIHVAEPKQQNSGIPQGVFLKRHRIPGDAGHVGLSNLVVGGQVSLYGRTFHIYACDPFTRHFLGEQGIEVAEDMELSSAQEPIEEYRLAHMKKGSGGPPKPRQDDLTRFIEAKLGRASNSLNEDKLQQFVDNDGKVLRFFCVWDDRESLYGERLKYILHYFLADDTIEILEEHKANTGRAPFPVFLKRDKLPLGKAPINTLGSRGVPVDSVGVEHLRVGATLTVYGRDFFMYGCDNFTKQYYKTNNSLTEGDLADIDITEEVKPLPKNSLPPYNGFGSLEDSKQNCIMLITKPPKKNFHKIMDNEKKLMRFIARMSEDQSLAPGYKLTAADVDRRFILQYFLADDTISIFEPPARNSGIVGGKFLERTRIHKPNTTDPYPQTELFVGARLVVAKRCFDLVEADEYTLSYMEKNEDQFPMSNRDSVLEKAKAGIKGMEENLRSAFIEMDADGSGALSAPEIEAAVISAGVALTKQEITTLVRVFDKDNDGKISIEEFFATFGKEYSE